VTTFQFDPVAYRKEEETEGASRTPVALFVAVRSDEWLRLIANGV
jgi:hypothetical protein